ncbi:hypothetical protein TPHA_0F00840 [Tetrapisispora phaffii CBS 4417]|uniref:Mms22p n=1 Tax=Tetrapisispora phaffii (strain ATCC 24235 / CBS 4417 / NBRC 1672 / NRRL Y-8282 / UCD 70-5) TaxID=1071381 RepID=G8BUY8_TETPH|nr:hypothetical protein TPHA_0F00840 [Tetrapisispora phaffii CBS 4417]CCE63570.1 hypothetical protein TPHA_0F00840 [Tetrapisispora phaffii CBS 4417]
MNSDDDTFPVVIPDSDTDYNECARYIIYKPVLESSSSESADSEKSDSDSDIGFDTFYINDSIHNPRNEIFQDSQNFCSEEINKQSSIANSNPIVTPTGNILQLSTPLSDQKVDEQHSSNTSNISDIYNSFGLRRRLRTRKAIQKMPYSLDRLKHRQLLQGYDVSNFDFISDKVKLPSHPVDANSQEKFMENINPNSDIDTDDAMFTENIYNLDSDPGSNSDSSESTDVNEKNIIKANDNEQIETQEDIPNKYLNKSNDLMRVHEEVIEIEAEEENEESEADKEEQEEEHIIFRGRNIDIRKGFRGILPKIAWDKSLKEKRSAVKRKKTVLNGTYKGLAKKKKIKQGNTNDDIGLLNELIAPDNDTHHNSNGILEDLIGLRNENIAEETEQFHFKETIGNISQFERYMDDKYADLYLSDEEDSNNDVHIVTYEVNKNKDIKNIKFETATSQKTHSFINKENSIDTGNNFLPNATSFNGLAEETNKGTLDFMLSKQSKQLKNNTKQSEKKGSIRSLKSYLHRHQNSRTKSFRKGVNKSSIKYLKLNTRDIKTNSFHKMQNATSTEDIGKTKLETYRSSNKSTIETEKSGFEERKASENVSETLSKKLKNQTKNNYFGLNAGNNDVNFRKGNTFSTVLETLGNKYAIRKRNKIGTHITELADLSANSESHLKQKKLKVVDALFYRKQININEVEKIMISNKTFILSKLDLSKLPSVLTNIFLEITEHGVVDTELITICHQLTEFLYFLNQPSLYHIIEDFHKRFRDKVATMGIRTKPIHFYQIMICQLMFFEISKYADISSTFISEIYSKILDHISSFFSLLSKCYIPEFDKNSVYLLESYNILVLIVTQLGKEKELWNRFVAHHFKPDICFLILNLFPTETAYWPIMQIENSYLSLSEAFKFTKFSIQHSNWKLSSSLILFFNGIYKKRRFQDFEKESALSFKSQVISNFENVPSNSSLFNTYLYLLYQSELSDSDIEKIMPLGEVSCTDPYSILVNRINLLLVLSKKSTWNLEKRFDVILKSIIFDPKIGTLETRDLQRITTLVLNAQVNMFENNRNKNMSYKSKVIADIYDTLIHDNKALWSIWYHYLKEVTEIMKQCSTTDLNMLKNLYRYLAKSITIFDMFPQSVIVVNLLISNLSQLGAKWTKNRLLPTIKDVLKDNRYWIDAFCKIGSYLIKSGDISWWSLLVYTDMDHSLDDKIYFFNKVLLMCDNRSFGMIKQYMYGIIIELIFTKSDELFENFINNLLKRENAVEYLYIDSSPENQKLQACKRLFAVLAECPDNTLLDRLIRTIQDRHLDNSLPHESVFSLISFLNSKYIDSIKHNNIFIILKRELGISDVEFEKSSFRDTIKNFTNINDRAEFIENCLVESLSVQGEAIMLSEKLISLFNSNMHMNTIGMFSDLVKCHILSNSIKQNTFMLAITGFLLQILNSHIENIFGQLSSEEFTNIHGMLLSLCKSFSFTDSNVDDYLNVIIEETSRLFISSLQISEGFKEYNLICKLGRGFLYNETLSREILDDKSSEIFDVIPIEMQQKIQQVIQRNKNNYNNDSFYKPTVEIAYSSHLRELLPQSHNT